MGGKRTPGPSASPPLSVGGPDRSISNKEHPIYPSTWSEMVRRETGIEAALIDHAGAGFGEVGNCFSNQNWITDRKVQHFDVEILPGSKIGQELGAGASYLLIILEHSHTVCELTDIIRKLVGLWRDHDPHGLLDFSRSRGRHQLSR